MKIIDENIDKAITEHILAKRKKERAKHEPSGKLSASMLGQPLQWQILKMLGVPSKEIDEYTLRKFERGNHVEEFVVNLMPDVLVKQGKVEYRNVVGYFDATGSHDRFGELPYEIKSVANFKYKHIIKSGEADRSHILQACLYALALKKDYFAIVYVASDDYRVTTFIYQTKDYKAEVDRVIDTFEKQFATGIIPVFEPVEKWQANKQYNSYPEWSGLSQEEINKKLEVK